MSATAECTLYSAFASLIADLTDGTSQTIGQQLEAVVTQAFDRECLDAYVLAYRSMPDLLGYALTTPELRTMTAHVLGLAHDQLLASKVGLSTPVLEPLQQILTKRELEVFGLVSQGFTNPQIAEQLVISPSTAKVHVRNILRKLGARTRMEAILRFGSTDA